jgi:hypothetical protein
MKMKHRPILASQSGHQPHRDQPVAPIAGTCLLLLTAAILNASPVYCCEPILPLAQLFSGTLLSGPLLTKSLWTLLAAVLIKSVSFVFLEPRLSWYQAVPLMLSANIVTSLFGLGLCFFPMVPGVIPLFSLGVVFVLSLSVATRLRRLDLWPNLARLSAWMIAVLMTGLYLLTIFLFALAQNVLGHSALIYWLLKFFYIYAGLIISIGMTTVWEEWVIAGIVSRLSRNFTPAKCLADSFLISVTKANLITMLFVMGYAALKILPLRLHSPDFLVFWRELLARIWAIG